MLGIGSVYDLKTRKVPDILWLVFGGIGAILYIWDYQTTTSYYVIAIFTSSFVGVAIWKWKIAGAADCFAIIAMAVILSVHYEFVMMPIMILVMAFFIMVFGLMMCNISLNLAEIIRTKKWIFSEFKAESRYKKIFAFLAIHRKRRYERFVISAEKNSEIKSDSKSFVFLSSKNKKYRNNQIESKKKMYGNGKISEGDVISPLESESKESVINENNTSLLQLSQIEKNRWLRYITVDLPETKQHWQILLMLYDENKSLQLTQITEKLQAKTRDDAVLILKKMIKDGLLKADESNRNVKYSLSEKSIKNYFTFDPKDIGSADDIPQVTKHVVKSYLDMGLFVTVALQKIEKDEDRTDLIAYSYDSDKSISVEIESTSELLSHPEHVIYNMRKWSKMGFDMCHVWSSSKKLQEIYDVQITKEEAKDVSVFVIKTSNL